MTQTETWTIGRLLQWTTDYLAERGVQGARLDAEVLLAEARGCERIDLYASYAELADERTRTAFRELVRRRAEGTPVAYLVGRREFYSIDFQVTPDVLIPRPETELVVVTLLDRIKQQQPKGEVRVCDVGTGSGVLGICAAKHCDRALVLAIDISPEALRIAEANAKRHAVSDRVSFLQSDLFGAVPSHAEFDFIVSNPPYVSEAEIELAAPDVRDHEPRLALVAGPRGTEVIERLLPQASEHLKPGGMLLIEISPMILEAVCALVKNQNNFELGTTVKDLAGHARVIQMTRVER